VLRTDKTIWVVVAQPDSANGYRIASGPTVIAENLTVATATQIVDEHFVVRRIVETFEEREHTPISVTRAPL